MGKKVYDLSKYSKEELEEISKSISIDNRKEIEIELVGKYYYSQLLTENILLKYFDEFKKDPWGSYLKYFVSPENVYPILAIVDLKNRDINKQVYMRNDKLMDALIMGHTPRHLNMESYESLLPLTIEKNNKNKTRL